MTSLWKFLTDDNWFYVSPLDWLIIVLPIAFVIYMGWRSRRYVAQVSDFLTAGRLGGRYILGVADIANGLSIISLVAYVEVHYRTGFALTFWQNLTMPLGIILSMTGFVTYRYRATKAMSFGQFIEMRYSRGLRIFSSALRSTSEVLANMIMPAIAGRFFIYFLGLPQRFMLWGIEFDTFNVLILFCLSLALAIIFMGGRLSLMITDCIQGMFCYPIMAIFVGFILYKFSWNDQIVPVLTDRVANQSFLDPYDISDLRDFNLFYVGVTLLTVFLNRGNWLGSGSQSCAKSPHEAKMASLLGSYRSSLASVLYILVAVALIVYFNHKDFAPQAREVRNSISTKIADDIFTEPAHKNLKSKVLAATEQQQQIIHNVGVDKPLSEDENLDTRYLANIKNIITTNPDRSAEENASMYQQFRTLYDLYRRYPYVLFGDHHFPGCDIALPQKAADSGSAYVDVALCLSRRWNLLLRRFNADEPAGLHQPLCGNHGHDVDRCRFNDYVRSLFHLRYYRRSVGERGNRMCIFADLHRIEAVLDQFLCISVRYGMAGRIHQSRGKFVPSV